jgi:hypothetical protein
MNYSNVDIKVISKSSWGSKKDPTDYCLDTKTILVREDYFNQAKKNDPLSYHWIIHEFAHHIMHIKCGKDYIINNSFRYPDNPVERFAYAYQFYWLMQQKSCNTFDELCNIDQFFRHKKIYSQSLSYYWNNSNYIISEFNNL